MADGEGTPGGHKPHEREMLSFCERLRLEEKGTASEGGQRDNARADPEVDVESKGRNASSHSNVMACYRQDLPSVEEQLSAAKTRKNEAEHHRAQQVSTSVLAKHSKAEERHRQHIVEEKKNSEREVAKEASKRDAVLERKRRQEEEMKQRRLAEFAKSEKQRQEASERCAKLKKSPKSSLPETTFSSPTRPCVSLSAFDDISQYPPARMHKAHGSHQPRLGQKGASVYDRLYHNKSTGSLTNAAKERTPPALKTAQKPVTKVTNTMSEAATRGREKKQSSLKGSPSLSVHPGQHTSDKQKKTLQDATAASARKSSAPTEPTALSSSSKPAKVVLAHSAMKKQKTDAKAAPTTAEARQRPKQPPYLSATEPRVHLPSRGAKTGREQKNGKKVHPSMSSISRNPEGSHTSTQPLATTLPVPREPTEDALKGQLVHVAAEKSPRNSNDSGLGQRHSCEESRQPTHVHPIRDPGSDYNSDDTDGQSQEKQSPKPASAHLSPNQSATHITEIPSVVIQPAEDSHVNSKPAPGLTPTLMGENALLNGELTAPNTLPRRHSDTPRRKKGIIDVTPPNIFRPDRQGSLPSSFSGDFQAHFLHLKKPSASTDTHKESQTDSEEDDGEDLPSAKPTKMEDQEARRLLVNQIMQETRAEKKDLELKLANRIMKKTRTEEKECEGKPLPSDCSAPHTLIRVPSTPIVCHPSSEKGSDGREEEEEEEEEGRVKKLSAPALMMKRESVQFKTCTPYSGPIEALPSFSSEEALNTDDKDPSEMGLYLRMHPPAHRPPQSTDLILARDASSTGGAFCNHVSSEDDGDDPSGPLVSDGFCGAMMDEVLSGSDDNDQMDDEEFHKTFQVPADDIIETDSEDEGSSRDVLPRREGEPLVLTGQWVDEVESSSDEAVDVVASASDCKVEGDRVGSSPPQATQLQDEVEDSSHRRVNALSSENEGEDTVRKLGGGAKYVDDVSSESENEEQVWDGGTLCSKDGSVSSRTCKRTRLVKKDSMLLYSKLPLTSQKSFQSCPPVDDVVGTSSDEEGLSEQAEERDSGIQRTATVLPPPPLKGILKNRPPATQTSPSVKFSVENDDERFDIEQQLTECPREDIQLHRASALTPYHHRLAEVCEEDDEEDSGDTAPESVGGHSFTDSKTLPDDCISDSETEAMPNGSGTETPTHLSSHSGSHTDIEYKYKGYENEFQSLATKSHFADELDSYSSDSDLDTKPLSIYGV